MARTPRPHRPAAGDRPSSHVIGDPPASELYPLKRGGRAAPDRSREPVIGPACYDTGAQSRSGKRVVVNPETNAGPEVGPVENTKTRQGYGHAATEARHARRPGRLGPARTTTDP